MPCTLVPFEKTISAGEVAEVTVSSHESPLGILRIASVAEGLCRLDIGMNLTPFSQNIKTQFPKAEVKNEVHVWHKKAAKLIGQMYDEDPSILPLYPFGTPFQHQVWEELLRIPFGSTSTYRALSEKLGIKGGSRAIGTAIGSNPLAMLIPCHRVLRSDGGLGGFRWGMELKRKLLMLEGITTSNTSNSSQYSLF